MSGVIWGYININNKDIDEELYKKVENQRHKYKIDKYEYIINKNVFMGCGLQFITKESKREVLPFYDKESDLLITCDAIIDNRKELLVLLGINNKKPGDYTDSEYILMSYKKWGEECPKYLLGDFTFVIYDIKQNKVFCARDQVGMRCLYYYFDNNIFAFCSLSDPLLELTNIMPEINERWLTDFLSAFGVVHITEETETIFNGIKLLKCGNKISIKENKMIEEKYWDPIKNVKKLKLNSEKEYIDKFLEIYSEAVRCRLRCDGEVGLMLSSGLDSGSVAAIASRLLKEEGKSLKGFSSVPIKVGSKNIPKHLIEDETKGINILQNYISNLDVEFCKCEDKDSKEVMDYLVDVFEQPYKIIENSFWIEEIAKKSYEKGCKVLLTGQYGNSTVSFGDFLIHEKTLFKEGRFITFLKEYFISSKRYNVSKKKLGKEIIKALMPYSILRKKYLKYNPGTDRFHNCAVNRELIKKWNVEERFDKLNFNLFPQRNYDLKEIRENIVSPIGFTHISILDSKIALYNGIIKRDPTRDMRVIEFCLSLPPEMFVKDGIERYLIRKSMKGYLPDEIRLNLVKRGYQASDWIYRLSKNWDNTFVEIKQALNNEKITKYLDIDFLKEEIETIRVLDDDTEKYKVRMFLIILSLSKFFDKYNF